MSRYNNFHSSSKPGEAASPSAMLDFVLWFNAFYTKKRKPYVHVSIWLFFSALALFGLNKNYNLSLHDSFLYTERFLVGNVFIFYSFFYFIYPRFFLNKKILQGTILLIIAYFIYQANEYLGVLLVLKYANIENPGLFEVTMDTANKGFLHIFSLKSFFGSLIYIVSYLSPIFCLKIIADVTKSTYKARELEKQKAELEIGFLKSQLNPHFLFNTLNSIYILNMKDDESASDVILELSDTLRYTLYESNTERVFLEKELLFLENYVNLERVRQNKRTRITYNCDMESAADLTIAPLLTFPFIENAFKHGLGTSLKDAWLEMETKVVDGYFYFWLRNSKNEENNGPQLDEYSGGIGVANTKKRLALLYPERHILKIRNTPDEYSIYLKINLNYEQTH